MASTGPDNPGEPGGGFLIDKPVGMTSFDVVAGVRRRQRRKIKVGHAGTLDPFATGLLIVLVGRATRLQRYLLPLPKTYIAAARLGWVSTTGDPDGELTHTGKVPDRLELPTGVITQKVPMTSAVKVGGERLYRKAHRGEVIETPSREITVYDARLLGVEGDLARFEVTVSAGTYVRTLVETLGDAYCAELRRTAIGPFRVDDCSEERLLSPLELLATMPRVEVGEAEARRLTNGAAVAMPDPAAAEGEVLAVEFGHRLVAVARLDEGTIRPQVVIGAPSGDDPS